jgi:hypothetical protein
MLRGPKYRLNLSRPRKPPTVNQCRRALQHLNKIQREIAAGVKPPQPAGQAKILLFDTSLLLGHHVAPLKFSGIHELNQWVLSVFDRLLLAEAFVAYHVKHQLNTTRQPQLLIDPEQIVADGVLA